MRQFSIFILILLLISCNPATQKEENWIQLFNGENLEGWTPKFNHSELGINYKNTFRVSDSVLKVSYEEYENFSDEFGHLFYEKSYSNYKIRFEYRFTGEQVTGGQAWAIRNNGIMLHCQPPESIELDQSFPVSIEAQLLGGIEDDERPTGNVCTPGTHIEINGNLITEHCIRSNSKTFNGDQWVRFEAVVFGDSIIHHIVNGDTVMTYRKPVIGGDLPESYRHFEGLALSKGYIAIQAESAPTEFRKIELLELK
ncbi:MAG: DUF1080 domain-containing protein [Bacteroidales bacterium]|nr:DUF1080 domain-containing protein [Bacteroidales bacterium]MCF8389388.1 DUF1080 domain-containing protein [Bacteroidales bacterium]